MLISLAPFHLQFLKWSASRLCPRSFVVLSYLKVESVLQHPDLQLLNILSVKKKGSWNDHVNEIGSGPFLIWCEFSLFWPFPGIIIQQQNKETVTITFQFIPLL